MRTAKYLAGHLILAIAFAAVVPAFAADPVTAPETQGVSRYVLAIEGMT